MKDYANENWYKNLVFVKKNKKTNLKEKNQPQQKIAALVTIGRVSKHIRCKITHSKPSILSFEMF